MDFLVNTRGLLRQPLTKKALDALLDVTKGWPLALSLVAALLRTTPLQEVLRQLSGELYQLGRREESRIVKSVEPQIKVFSGELIHHLKKAPEKIYDVTSRQFEQLIADIFSDLGWEVHLTKATRDGGRDILAHLNTGIVKLLCLIEAKKYSKTNPVGIQLVRNLYGTLCDEQANSGILVTTSYFTDDAKKFRTGMSISCH